MTRLGLFAATAMTLGSLSMALPAFAANSTQPATTGTQQNAGDSNQSASGAQQLVSDSVQTVKQMRQDTHFANLLSKAKGVFILPDVVKGAFVVGGKGGQGVLMANHSGTWSDPAFMSIGSVSVGAQAGGAAGPVVMLLMTDKAMNDFTQANNFSLGANAGLTIINYAAHGQAPVGKGDIVIWQHTSGAYGGLNVSGTDVTANTQQDQAYYGKHLTTAQIVHGQANVAKAESLKSALAG